MASPTAPTHGKLGALYVLRPNGFSGIGLNDVTWGLGYNGVATGYFEVVIDGAGAPDTFKWRKNGGAWTTLIAITGAAQTLSDAQTITFAATTGHTLNDQWVIGNLAAEPTDEAGSTAQITAAANRLLNPNATVTFTDSGGKKVTGINYTNGKATFDGAVTIVTVAGNNGFVPGSALRKVAYLLDWSLDLSVEMADTSAMGDKWKTALPGEAGGSGKATAYFIASETLLNCLLKSIAGGDKYFLLQLFNYDPDQDQTGDHLIAWATFTAFAPSGVISAVVKEAVNFQVDGEVSFTANV